LQGVKHFWKTRNSTSLQTSFQKCIDIPLLGVSAVFVSQYQYGIDKSWTQGDESWAKLV